MADIRLSKADKAAIVKAAVDHLAETAERAAAAKVAEALDGVQPTRPLHEMSREEREAFAAVVLPAHVTFGGRKVKL